MTIRYRKKDGNGGTVQSPDTLLKKCIIANITNNFVYPTNEMPYFAGTTDSYKAVWSYVPVKRVIWTLGMVQNEDKTFSVPRSFYWTDSSKTHPTSGYYSPINDPGGSSNIQIKNSMIFGTYQMKYPHRRDLVLRDGNQYVNILDTNSNAISFRFAVDQKNYQNDSLVKLMNNSVELGDITLEGYAQKLQPLSLISDTTIAGKNIRVKVIRPDSVVIWDTDVRAQIGATFKLELRSFPSEKQEPTGVYEGLSENVIFSILPNPSSDNISILMNKGACSFAGKISVTIFNSLGIELKRFNGSEFSGQSSINISTEDFPPGIYFCSFAAGSYFETKEFVVIR